MIRPASTPSGQSRHSRWLIIAATLVVGCQTQRITELPADAVAIYPQVADLTLPVSCLLPGQVRRLGGEITYLTPRRPAITSANDCELRGGDYAQFDRAEYETALQVWLQEARSGDPRAQTFVGEIYARGLGIEPDYTIARQWYRKAAAQNFPRAQVQLGLLYDWGCCMKRVSA
ncbi:MAG: tetratricopeptide repeat protein [Gammaproteobacteria bacterium]